MTFPCNLNIYMEASENNLVINLEKTNVYKSKKYLLNIIFNKVRLENGKGNGERFLLFKK